MILIGQATLVAMQGDIAEAKELRARGGTIMNDLGEWIWIASFWWAFISLWEEDPVAAERELRPGYEALKKLGSKSHFSSFAHLLSNAVYAQGRYDEAERLTHECEQASRPNDVHSQILWRSTRAKVLARRGLLEPAELLARQAVEFAATSDFHPAHAEALMDLAEVLNLAGEANTAATAVEEAIRFYELKGNVLAADRARALSCKRMRRKRTVWPASAAVPERPEESSPLAVCGANSVSPANRLHDVASRGRRRGILLAAPARHRHRLRGCRACHSEAERSRSTSSPDYSPRCAHSRPRSA
jgi:tetratricopeptide (TPR) repeat protein